MGLMIFLRLEMEGGPVSRFGFNLGTSGNDTAVGRAMALRERLRMEPQLRQYPVLFDMPEVASTDTALTDLVIPTRFRAMPGMTDSDVLTGLFNELNLLMPVLMAEGFIVDE
jgi:hypothetical protein